MKGYKPNLHKLDNESSKTCLDWITPQQPKIQFTPPEMYQTSTAEKALQTWKNHFLAGLASSPANFQIMHWCQLIQQANVTLNLLRLCHQNPALSAQEAMHETFHFEATQMVPPGIECYVHITPH